MRLKPLFILILIAMFLVACGKPTDAHSDEFVAQDGILDLTNWNFKEQPLVKLNGDWTFYWNRLYEPDDFEQHVTLPPTGKIKLPSNWEDYSFHGTNLPREGYATFRLHIESGRSHEVLGLKLPIMYANYALWVDDQLVAKNGRVGTNKNTSVAQKNPQVVYFSPERNDFTMTLQISNFHEYSGGMWEPIVMGDWETIHNGNLKKVASQSVMIGLLLLSGIYHFGLSVFRKTDSYFFYFGAFCTIAAFRYLMVGEVLLVKVYPDIDWEMAMRMEYISLYLHVPLWGMVMYRLFPKDSSRLFIYICSAAAAVYTVFTLVMEAKIYYQWLIYFQAIMVLGAGYCLIVIMNAARRKREGALHAVVGVMILIGCICFDIFGFILQYPELNLYPLGIVIFIICFSLVISKRLSSSLILTEKFATDLSQLNRELEKKVEERTHEIQLSHNQLLELNDQLKRMVRVDGLTNIANRRHFDDYFEEVYQICSDKHEPIALFYIDIDYFKLYNDRYGHQQGDECLRLVAHKLNEQLLPFNGGLVARYGGEEFVCVIPNCDEEKAERIAGELNHSIEQLQIKHTASQASSYVTISIGLACGQPDEHAERHTLVMEADRALYQAKQAGRNRYVRLTVTQHFSA